MVVHDEEDDEEDESENEGFDEDKDEADDNDEDEASEENMDEEHSEHGHAVSCEIIVVHVLGCHSHLISSCFFFKKREAAGKRKRGPMRVSLHVVEMKSMMVLMMMRTTGRL